METYIVSIKFEALNDESAQKLADAFVGALQEVDSDSKGTISNVRIAFTKVQEAKEVVDL